VETVWIGTSMVYDWPTNGAVGPARAMTNHGCPICDVTLLNMAEPIGSQCFSVHDHRCDIVVYWQNIATSKIDAETDVGWIDGSELASLLENIQYNAGLLLTGALKNTSYARILSELGWEPISGRVKLLRPTILHSTIHGNISHYFSNYILNRLRRHGPDYNLRNRHQFIAPMHRTQRYSRSFIPASITLWNNLAPDLKLAKSTDSFKLQFKRAYFNNIRNPVYSLGDRSLNIAHACFQLNFTSLNHDLHPRTFYHPQHAAVTIRPTRPMPIFFLSCPVYANKLFLDTTPLIWAN
jgi:hypothetical protein